MKLSEKSIIQLKSNSREGALQELSALAARLEPELKEEHVLNALLHREQIGSTYIGNGIAIPHTKVEGVRGKLLALGYSETGIQYDGQDKRPVQVLVLLLGQPGENLDYLLLLGKLGRMLRDENNLELLLDTGDPAQLGMVFTRMLRSTPVPVMAPHVGGDPALEIMLEPI